MFSTSLSLSKFKLVSSSSSSSFSHHQSLFRSSSFASNNSVISADHKQLALHLSNRLSAPHLHQIHARIFRLGLDQDNLLATKIIGHSQLPAALRVFRHLHNPNVFPFNAIIRIHAQSTSFSQSFSLFKSLKNRSISPNEFTLSFLLKACFRSVESAHVRQIHTHIVKLGFERDPFVLNGLLAVYAKVVGDVASARQLFDEIPGRNEISCWTHLITGFSKLGQSEEALVLFMRMVEKNLRPENDTMVSVLSACSRLEIQEIKKWERNFLQKQWQLDDRDDVDSVCSDSIRTVLVYLYAKCGKIEDARKMFDKMSQRKGGVRSILAWNSMIGGYAQNGFPIEALALFHLMVEGCSSPKPNHVTMVNALCACSQVGSLDLGKWIHEYTVSTFPKGILETNPFLATAFIDMYAKCGSLDSAKQVFNRLACKDVVSFNAMIMGFAINGQGGEALTLFSKMKAFGACPNDGTFMGVLCACTHTGLVVDGRLCFEAMDRRYLITPKLEHYACYVDLLARAGHVEEAFDVVNAMPIEPNGLVWGALLGACLIHSKVALAKDVARKIVDLDPHNSGAYVLLSNVYAEDGRWDVIAELRAKMKEKGVRKQTGCSWISVDGVVHEFVVGSASHPEIQRIYHTLEGLLKEMRLAGCLRDMPMKERVHTSHLHHHPSLNPNYFGVSIKHEKLW